MPQKRRSGARTGVLALEALALGTNLEAARPFHDAASPTHSSLVGPYHRLVELFELPEHPPLVCGSASGGPSSVRLMCTSEDGQSSGWGVASK
jgi:hypothetical protein